MTTTMAALAAWTGNVRDLSRLAWGRGGVGGRLACLRCSAAAVLMASRVCAPL